jgi:hypothetical protein
MGRPAERTEPVWVNAATVAANKKNQTAVLRKCKKILGTRL